MNLIYLQQNLDLPPRPNQSRVWHPERCLEASSVKADANIGWLLQGIWAAIKASKLRMNHSGAESTASYHLRPMQSSSKPWQARLQSIILRFAQNKEIYMNALVNKFWTMLSLVFKVNECESPAAIVSWGSMVGKSNERFRSGGAVSYTQFCSHRYSELHTEVDHQPHILLEKKEIISQRASQNSKKIKTENNSDRTRVRSN